MAKETLSVVDRLTNLLSLQVIDSKIDDLQVLKGELPMEVSDLEDEIAGLAKRNERIAGNIQDLKDTISGRTAKIKESETLISRYEKQLDNVKNNREYDALTKEIELQKLDMQLCEKKIGETQSTLDVKEGSFKEAKKKLKGKNEELKIKKEELEKIIVKTDKEEKKLTKKATAARGGIEDRLLKSYDKIRTSYRNGLAVVAVERDACGGCFNKIPPQTQLEIRMRKKLVVCEHCNRVLVDDEIMEDAKASIK